MADKYIIRNCPALYQINGMTNECLGADYQCQDCTDCVLKQIVELCKNVCLTEKHLIHKSSTFNLANKILKLLDIQECE